MLESQITAAYQNLSVSGLSGAIRGIAFVCHDDLLREHDVEDNLIGMKMLETPR